MMKFTVVDLVCVAFVLGACALVPSCSPSEVQQARNAAKVACASLPVSMAGAPAVPLGVAGAP